MCRPAQVVVQKMHDEREGTNCRQTLNCKLYLRGLGFAQRVVHLCHQTEIFRRSYFTVSLRLSSFPSTLSAVLRSFNLPPSLMSYFYPFPSSFCPFCFYLSFAFFSCFFCCLPSNLSPARSVVSPFLFLFSFFLFLLILLISSI